MDWLVRLIHGNTEIPSVPDIVPEDSISIVDSKLMVDFSYLNIPFTRSPKIYPKVMIPDTNSMDGIADYGNNFIYIEPADEENHKIMVDWIAQKWLDSKGLDTCDCVYRIPRDWSKPAQVYAIHRIKKVAFDNHGRYFIFKGVNNLWSDPLPARDENILYLSAGVIY
jgi:hypothetical protein